MSAARSSMASLVAPIMVEAKQGLIVQISSTGGAQYLFNTPYGVAHAAMDRLTADMAAELTELGVQCVTLWPLSCVTEKAAFPDGESPTFVGRCLPWCTIVWMDSATEGYAI